MLGIFSLFLSGSWSSADDFIDNLRSDSIPLNAQETEGKIWGMIHEGNLSSKNVEDFKKGIDSDDYQFRHYSTRFLSDYFIKDRIPEVEWPERLMVNLVEGLYDDKVSCNSTFSNSTEYLGFLYRLKERRPVESLKRAVSGKDSQARFAASLILANYLQNSVQPQISKELYFHLQDDRIYQNELAACQGFMLLGRENFIALLKRIPVMDWQQAAFMQFLTAYFDIPWKAKESHIREWVKRVSSEEKYFVPDKISMAALYLTPNHRRYFQDKKIPDLISRMDAFSRNLKKRQKRAEWARSWFWFLRSESKEDYPYPCGAWLALIYWR